VWAQARPQHDIDATKDWTLKIAKKTRAGKKRGAGLFKGVKIKELGGGSKKEIFGPRSNTAVVTTSTTSMGETKVSSSSTLVPPTKAGPKIPGIGGPPPSGNSRRRNKKDKEKEKEGKKKKKKKKKKKSVDKDLDDSTK
jgi:hypothetical protein|tara:strand:- start:30 stop:446 length:417 start_codon:yes stop_codon:yes gene_type:complete